MLRPVCSCVMFTAHLRHMLTLPPAWAAGSSWPLQSLQVHCWSSPRRWQSTQPRCVHLVVCLCFGVLPKTTPYLQAKGTI
jgi:hypothetical protein